MFASGYFILNRKFKMAALRSKQYANLNRTFNFIACSDMLNSVNMQSIIIVAVSILGCIFIGSFVALIALCRHMYYTKKWTVEQYERVDEARLVLGNDDDEELDIADVDIFNCDEKTMQKLLETEAFAFDAQGVMPQCITILKLCRQVTEKLVALTMGMNAQDIHPQELAEIIQIAQRIAPRVDVVMNSLQPPLNSEKLENNCAALIMSVSHLAMVVKRGCRIYVGSLNWIDDSVSALHAHMKVLRNIASMPVKHDQQHQTCYQGTATENRAAFKAFEDSECSKL